MNLPTDYWVTHPIEAGRMAAVADGVAAAIPKRRMTDEIKNQIEGLLLRASWRAA
jgi:hypothetical protein